jgi:catechol 2,3-dioxygenase-like lactoylglutathione lyase family enzyme
MANERTYPCLPCRDLDPAVAFYEALGFRRTYRQLKPNPYAVVQRDDIHIHLFGMPDFDPAQSYGNVIVVVPDPDALYQSFADGLRAAYGKIPVAGIPRLLRPRKKFGTVAGFSVVDIGGNWLRVSRAGDTEEEQEEATGLAKIVLTAARLGDAHGDDAKAMKTLESGLARFPDAPRLEYAKAMLYRAELAVRLNNPTLARASLDAATTAELSPAERDQLADEIERTAELVRAASGP